MSDEIINPPTTPGNILDSNPRLTHSLKIAVEINESCLKQAKATFTHKNVKNLFIVFELEARPKDLNTKFILRYCFLGVVKLTKNDDSGKYG